MTNKNLVTVLQSLNQKGITSFISYLKTYVATIEPSGITPFIPSIKCGCCNC